ncbi:MAG: hypothetical protein KDA85_20630, partial [Planctomycetaceae bacterium]|nr:hypothetical protein [Planctomycetaceae bacterium]
MSRSNAATDQLLTPIRRDANPDGLLCCRLQQLPAGTKIILGSLDVTAEPHRFRVVVHGTNTTVGPALCSHSLDAVTFTGNSVRDLVAGTAVNMHSERMGPDVVRGSQHPADSSSGAVPDSSLENSARRLFLIPQLITELTP